MTTGSDETQLTSLKGMYEEYFLDYASYVILERAVPAIQDGFKPVQRRILFAMKEMDDGRYHKVANIIGQTMQFHPHGDAAIGDALVNLGQKDLLIDCQGNWGDIRTGDSAAAPRYIEARLTKFALEVAFNRQTAEWQLTYDGRKKEPIHLPVKFPMILAQGVDGIAVGLSTKILPHNFIELIEASIKALKGKRFNLYPDFQTAGMIDVSQYQGGIKGSKIRNRAKITIRDKKHLVISELPYGSSTNQLIESIIKANDKGKIKIKRVVDNTAKDVEIVVELPPGVSPDVTIGALYAFTDCEISISPNACVIIDHKPHFLTVEDMLKISTEKTKQLLKLELEIKQGELEAKWHSASLEKVFIENRIYHEIEECETWEAVISTIDGELKKYVVTPADPPQKGDTRIRLNRSITTEDITKLTEIKIKRISKYNKFKADEHILQIEEDLEQVRFHLDHLIDYCVKYFKDLLEKYGKGKERKTKITTFDSIQATQVIANNAKLYANYKEGFIGYGLKQDEFVCDCSDIDDIIVFRKDGKFQVTRIADKVFVGKNIIHVNKWSKADDRTTYNMAYLDGSSGRTMVKRFQVKSITRDKEYVLTKGTPNSRVLYFTANPNGESEVVSVQLSQGCKAKKKLFDFDYATLDIKGRSSQGNILTKYPVRKIIQKEVGKSTLGAQPIWMDEVSGNLNKEERGIFLGHFDTGNLILVITRDGCYELTDFELTNRYQPQDILTIEKFVSEKPISVIYYDGEKGWTMVKRFNIETSTLNQKFNFITEHRSSKLLMATTMDNPIVEYSYKVKRKTLSEKVALRDFIDVKGWKALGNRLKEYKVTSTKLITSEEKSDDSDDTESLHAGDTIEFDINPQQTIFDLNDED